MSDISFTPAIGCGRGAGGGRCGRRSQCRGAVVVAVAGDGDPLEVAVIATKLVVAAKLVVAYELVA